MVGKLKGILSHIFASSGESIHRFTAVYSFGYSYFLAMYVHRDTISALLLRIFL
jgi:hypothetical protein